VNAFAFLCLAVLFSLAVSVLSAAPAEAQTSGYKLPPKAVVDIIDAPPTPAPFLSPDRQTMLLADYEAYPSIAWLARPYLKLGGARVDPQLGGTQRTSHYSGITIQRLSDGKKTRLPLPDGAKIGGPAWSIDSRRFAFTRDTDETGIEVWVADAERGTSKRLEGVRATDVLGGPFSWMDDSRTLLVYLVPNNRGPAPETPRVPEGPVIEETQGKVSKMATYQDLLQNAHDEALFAYYGTAQLALVDTDTSTITPLGKPDLYTSARPSPDEKYLLVFRLKRPFSYRVPAGYFARDVQIWTLPDARTIRTIADLPISDQVPQQGVPTGPRGAQWQEKTDATLLYVEALDEGDPLKKVPHRDRVLRLRAPFTGSPEEVLKVTHRFAGWDWTDKTNEVLMAEYDRDRRWSTTYFLDLAKPEATKRVIFDLSVNDAYNDPGNPVYQVKPNGDRTLLQDGDHIYLYGRGATPEGDRPFLDRMNLRTLEKERLFRCDDASYEAFVAFAGADSRDRLIMSYQTRTQPANYFVRDRRSGQRTALTDFKDPHPQITGLKKELVKYQREKDGVPLSGTLYLPPDYDPSSGKRLPLLIWAYPEEYSDARTAGQVRGSTNTFTRLAGTSPLWFVTQGYAVLNDATMPVVGDPETMNDTFVEQIVGAAKAAIDTLDARGLIDRNRVLVAGHSYGAFMTANLLAHSDGLFAAGIARSGAYNRTLTPFGFQSERRSFWDARDVYVKLSPFTYANQIKEPILLIHGQADNNSGTYTVQSERFYQALQANGATARLVLLPHESHGYRARESVLHVLAEMFDWANKYVKNKESK
jgi:dipeptidyl aminopeptidase/acylaminoacyl peptidase